MDRECVLKLMPAVHLKWAHNCEVPDTMCGEICVNKDPVTCASMLCLSESGVIKFNSDMNNVDFFHRE